jgi:biotin synthase
MNNIFVIKSIKEKILSGKSITRSDAEYLSLIENNELFDLFFCANELRTKFRGDLIDLCAIINAKSGACSEDCSYCAQSSKSKAGITVYPLLNKKIILEKAEEAKILGVKRFCIVTSGRKISNKELKEIGEMIGEVRKLGLLPCATLGLLNKDELSFLKEKGLERYHHNLETSERFFPEICRTHTFNDKLRTIEAAKSIGLSVCSGGIFGMGETWQDRIDMAFKIKELDVDSVPINYLMPIKGTALDGKDMLNPFEALKIISIYRFLLPQKEIRICGGRIQALRDFHSWIFFAGADSVLTGNYLTTTGRSYDDDVRLIKQHGLKIA